MSEDQDELTTDSSPDPASGSSAEPPAEPASVEAEAAEETPAARIAVLEKEKAEARERMMRIAADFENWKKRARKDQADAEIKATERVLKDFLEVVDNLERASNASTDVPQARAILDGVRLVLRLFQSKFERYDVKPIESIGKAFDPRLHEAVARMPTADAAPGQIVQELVRGYTIGDRLLRPAAVAVAVAPPQPDAGTETGAAAPEASRVAEEGGEPPPPVGEGG